VQNILGTAEGRLGIDDPILTKEGTDQSVEQLGSPKGLWVSIKPQFPLLESPPKAGHKLAPKDAAERLDEVGRGEPPRHRLARFRHFAQFRARISSDRRDLPLTGEGVKDIFRSKILDWYGDALLEFIDCVPADCQGKG
jgi:hypothetical protein